MQTDTLISEKRSKTSMHADALWNLALHKSFLFLFLSPSSKMRAKLTCYKNYVTEEGICYIDWGGDYLKVYFQITSGAIFF